MDQTVSCLLIAGLWLVFLFMCVIGVGIAHLHSENEATKREIARLKSSLRFINLHLSGKQNGTFRVGLSSSQDCIILFYKDEVQPGGDDLRISDLPVEQNSIWVCRQDHPPIKVDLPVEAGDIIEVYPSRSPRLDYCSPVWKIPMTEINVTGAVVIAIRKF